MSLKERSEDLKEFVGFFKKIGQAEAMYAMQKATYVTRIVLLKEIMESKEYKSMPGITKEDVFDMFNISKTTGYEELKAIDNLGLDLIALMGEQGIPVRDVYLFRKMHQEIQDVEFEVIDSSKGEYKVNGKSLIMAQDKAVIGDAIMRIMEILRLARLANQGLESKLEKKETTIKKQAEEIERKKRTIEEGEKQLYGWEYTEFDRAMSEFMKAAKILSVTEWTEKDLKLVKRHYGEIYDSIIQPMNQLFQDKTRELEEIESGRHCRREGDVNEEDQGETVDEEDRAGGIA